MILSSYIFAVQIFCSIEVCQHPIQLRMMKLQGQARVIHSMELKYPKESALKAPSQLAGGQAHMEQQRAPLQRQQKENLLVKRKP